MEPRSSRASWRSWLRDDRTEVVLFCCLYAVVAVGVTWARTAVDYPAYLMAAAGFLEGQDVYSWTAADFARVAAARNIERYASAYPYSPWTAILIVPLLRLPFRLGLFLWTLVNGLAVVATGVVLGRLTDDRIVRRRICVATWLLCPFFVGLYAGQVNSLVTFLAAAAVLLAARREWSAGVCLGLSLLLKPLAVGVAAYAVWRARWKLVLAAALTFVVASGVAVLWLGPEALGFLERQAVWTPRGYPPSQNLPGLVLRRLAGDPTAPIPAERLPLVRGAGMAAALTIAAATLVVCWPAGRRGRWSIAELGLAVVTVLIANPRSWFHHYAMAAIPFAAVASVAGRTSRWMWSALAFAYASITLFGFGWHWFAERSLLLESAGIGGLALWLACVWAKGQEGAGASRSRRLTDESVSP